MKFDPNPKPYEKIRLMNPLYLSLNSGCVRMMRRPRSVKAAISLGTNRLESGTSYENMMNSLRNSSPSETSLYAALNFSNL